MCYVALTTISIVQRRLHILISVFSLFAFSSSVTPLLQEVETRCRDFITVSSINDAAQTLTCRQNLDRPSASGGWR